MGMAEVGDCGNSAIWNCPARRGHASSNDEHLQANTGARREGRAAVDSGAVAASSWGDRRLPWTLNLPAAKQGGLRSRAVP